MQIPIKNLRCQKTDNSSFSDKDVKETSFSKLRIFSSEGKAHPYMIFLYLFKECIMALLKIMMEQITFTNRSKKPPQEHQVCCSPKRSKTFGLFIFILILP